MIPKIDLDIKGNVEDTKVVVAMSGGVDSSVAAALVKNSGYSVIGITLQLYDHGSAKSKKGSCCAGQDIYDARKVAADLEIPHFVLNYEDIFRNKVINSFSESYQKGETPIPCVLCNEKVKFDDLFFDFSALFFMVLYRIYIFKVYEDNAINSFRDSDFTDI